jgi:DNA-directed RNA polymerase specialized sigma subunit
MLSAEEVYVQAFTQAFVNKTAYKCDSMKEDMLQAARIGVLLAIHEWKPATGGFSTLAYYKMWHEVQKAVRHVRPISIPRSGFLTGAEQISAKEFEEAEGREPSPGEAGINPRKLARAVKARASFLPLEDWRKPVGHHDTKKAPEPSVPPDVTEESIDTKRQTEALKEFMRGLSPDNLRALRAQEPAMLQEARCFLENYSY